MSVRSRSRSPLRGNEHDDDLPRYLFIGNLPKEWRYYHIKEFLVEQYLTDFDVIEGMGHIHLLRDSNNQQNGDSVVEFSTVECCQKALKALQGAEHEGKKLVIMTDTGKILPYNRRTKKNKWMQDGQDPPSMNPNKQKQKPGPPPVNFKEGKNLKTFGLSKEFLNNLGIQPPLNCRIFVGNLAPEVTETKLREVFSLAGTVAAAKRHQNWGKVIYDHPVEAVQAISMFHGQSLYNSKMVVQFDRSKYSPVLPEGLDNVGEGLGFAGKPLRAVRMTFELQPLKELLQHELAKMQQQSQQDLMLSVNTNQGQNNPLITLLQLLQDKMVGGPSSANWVPSQGSQRLNQDVFGNVMSQQTPPTSRFDIPPNALALAQNPMANLNVMANAAQNVMANAAQNAMANAAQNPLANMNAMANAAQNPLAHLQTALANLQNANVGQNQQPPRSRFDVPPSALTTAPNAIPIASASTSGGNLGWGSGQNDWNNYQGTSQNSQNQPSGFENSSYGNYQHNPDEFDVQRLSDLNKSEDKMKSSDMLLFQNLPPSVTSKALVNKMREVGELLFAEMTGQGRAVVRFRDSHDAERCVKLYDRSKVDGQVITVKTF